MLAAAGTDEASVDEFAARVEKLTDECQAEIDRYMTSERPGREVVPLAVYHRYIRRIAANLSGVVRTSSEPIPLVDYLEDGTIDTDD